ncbi:MAG: hypothetical protein H8K04_07155 [Nitrospira sp.]
MMMWGPVVVIRRVASISFVLVMSRSMGMTIWMFLLGNLTGLLAIFGFADDLEAVVGTDQAPRLLAEQRWSSTTGT